MCSCPNERIFLDGQVEFAAVFAHSLGLWERLGGVGEMADDGDLLVGLAQLIAEANGLAGVEHIKEKISEMIIHATLVRAGLEAAIATATAPRTASSSPTSCTPTPASTTAPPTSTRWSATCTTSPAAPC